MKKLTREDYALLKGYFEQQPYRLSAYSLPSAIAWSNACYQSFYDIMDGMVIMTTDIAGNPGNRYMLLPIAPAGDLTAGMMKDLLLKAGYEKICFVPDYTLEQIGREALDKTFTIAEQREYEDYIYLTKDLAELKGNRYAKKRNLIHQFTRDYVKHNRVLTGPLTGDEIPECLDFLEKWCAQRECETGQEENLACEKAAVIGALQTIDDLDWRGLWVRLDGEISAFAIISHLTPHMGVLNFEKAYPQIRGLYQFLDNECARQLFYDYQFINKESDMGLAALADSKRSYHPFEKIKSYCLKIKA